MSLLNLNLLNFELPQSRKCKYVLTSPRSLKACRKAGVKPIDLLYKSLSEIQKEQENKEAAREKFESFEEKRQHNLALCRKLRNDFILRGFPSRNVINSNEIITSQKDEHKSLQSVGVDDLRRTKKTTEHVKSKNYFSQCVESPTSDLSHEIQNLENCAKIREVEEDIIRQLSLNQSPPGSPGKDKLEIKSPSSMCSPKKQISHLENKQGTPTSPEASEESNGIKQKGRILSPLEPDKKGVHFEDANNNQVIKISNKRTSLPCRKKIREKKKLKALENERLYYNLCQQYSDPEYCLHKYKQVIENRTLKYSLERELREQEVHRVQRELEEGLERWQDHVLLLQWLDSLRAQEQASKELEMKVEKLQRTARSKNILHTMNYNKIKRDQDIKAELLRRIVEDKEKKILNFNKERDRIICESKTRAQSVSELKEQIRNILMPETFDKKVFKCGLQKKLLNARATCPGTMHSSHIRLA